MHAFYLYLCDCISISMVICITSKHTYYEYAIPLLHFLLYSIQLPGMLHCAREIIPQIQILNAKHTIVKHFVPHVPYFIHCYKTKLSNSLNCTAKLLEAIPTLLHQKACKKHAWYLRISTPGPAVTEWHNMAKSFCSSSSHDYYLTWANYQSAEPKRINIHLNYIRLIRRATLCATQTPFSQVFARCQTNACHRTSRQQRSSLSTNVKRTPCHVHTNN